MGAFIKLTSVPVRLTATGVQPYTDVIDVTAYERFEFWVIAYEASGTTPTFDLKIQTSMVNTTDSSDMWSDLATFAQIIGPNKSKAVTVTSGTLRYIRWSAVIGGTTPGITFDVWGIARPG